LKTSASASCDLPSLSVSSSRMKRRGSPLLSDEEVAERLALVRLANALASEETITYEERARIHRTLDPAFGEMKLPESEGQSKQKIYGEPGFRGHTAHVPVELLHLFDE